MFTPLFLPVVNMLRCGMIEKAQWVQTAMRWLHG